MIIDTFKIVQETRRKQQKRLVRYRWNTVLELVGGGEESEEASQKGELKWGGVLFRLVVRTNSTCKRSPTHEELDVRGFRGEGVLCVCLFCGCDGTNPSPLLGRRMRGRATQVILGWGDGRMLVKTFQRDVWVESYKITSETFQVDFRNSVDLCYVNSVRQSGHRRENTPRGTRYAIWYFSLYRLAHPPLSKPSRPPQENRKDKHLEFETGLINNL